MKYRSTELFAGADNRPEQARLHRSPAISEPYAMAEYPNARKAERNALLDLVDLVPGMTIVDIQAAGGYLAEGAYERLGGQVHCVCVEPGRTLSRRLKPYFTLCEDEIDALQSLASNWADAVLGLAGLHHSPSKKNTVRECWRILKPGKPFAVCDVIEESAMARWLNEYVDRHNPAGHKGDFLVPGKATALMVEAGFTGSREEIKQVPWEFDSTYHAARFFKGLFALDRSVQDVESAMRDYLSLSDRGGRVEVVWELIYAVGDKADPV